MLPDFVRVHHYLATLIDGTAVLLNACLLYLIVYHSTFHMKIYKQILLLTCVGDLVLSATVLFGQPVSFCFSGHQGKKHRCLNFAPQCIIFDSEYVLFVSNGFFARRYELLDRVAMAAFCGGLHTNIVCVALQFLWRYQWITRDERHDLT